ncbi:MAG: hypothetical protein GQ531_01790 [Sulfurovum sp.]|nr:hypothetical protein [Sulfurovum sp.]
MKNVEKSWLRKISRLIMSFAVTLFFLGGTSVLNAAIKVNLEGCKSTLIDDGGYTKDDSSGDTIYYCNNDAYVNGNLKEWNELDMVPHHIEIENGTGSDATFSLAVGGDFLNSNTIGLVGWDYITPVILDVNATEDFGGIVSVCNSATLDVSDWNVSQSESNIFRVVRLAGLPDGAKCVYVYNMRLALGSSAYSGSSLHSRLVPIAGDINVGKQTLPLPDIPLDSRQTIDKTMTAVQNGSRVWSVDKNASDGTVDFKNTCDNAVAIAKEVSIIVTWTKSPDITPDGNASIYTVITASNAALRDINVTVTDTLYSDINLSIVLDEFVCDTVTIKANANKQLLCEHTFIVSDVDINDTLYDEAIAVYTDIDIYPALDPGLIINQTSARAFAIVQGSENNSGESATITDVESLSAKNNNIEYSVATPLIGEFVGYIADTKTTDDVNWTSGLPEQNSTKSVTFTKTLSIINRAIAADGTLFDTAQLFATDEIGANSGQLKIKIKSSPRTYFTLTKEINASIVPNEGLDFNFTVTNTETNETELRSIHVTKGIPIKSDSFWLDQGTYTIEEDKKPGYAVDGNSTRFVDLRATCTGSETFTNILADPPGVRVRKVTDPAGQEAGWTMELYRNNILVEQNTTTGTDFITLLDDLAVAGSYEVREEHQVGWYNVSRSGSCTFEYDPAVDGNSSDYDCIITNAEYATIIIKKSVNGNDDNFTFMHDIPNDSNETEFNLTDNGTQTYMQLTPGEYEVTEEDADLKLADHYLSGIVCDDNNSIGELETKTANINLSAGETVTCTFTNTERGRVHVLKTENSGPVTQTWKFTLSGRGDGEGKIQRETDENGTLDFAEIRLHPGNEYTLCEIDLPLLWRGTWKLDGNDIGYTVTEHMDENGTHLDVCYVFTADIAHTSQFEIDNVVLMPSLEIEKLTNGVESALVTIGDEITWTYKITNTGNTELSILSVIDDMEGAVTCPINLLPAGESMNCTAISGIADVSSYNNNVEVNATIPEGDCYIAMPMQVQPSDIPLITENICEVNASDNSGYLAEEEVTAGEGVIVCHGCESSGSPALGEISAILMVCMTLALGLLYIRREEENTLD